MASVASRAAAAIADFAGWWLGELWQVVPPPLRRRLTRSRQRIVVTLGDDTASVTSEVGGTTSLLAEIALSDEAAAAIVLAQSLAEAGLAARLREGSAEAALRIPGARSLRTVMKLPAAARSNLVEVVEFELDRHTPFRPDQVLFAAHIAAEDAESGLLEVAVVLVPRSTADEAVARVARLGFVPTRIDVAAPDGGPLTGNLLHAANDGGWQRGDRRVIGGLAGAAIVLAIVAVGLPVVLAQRADETLTTRFQQVRQSAVETAALRKKIEARRRTELFAIDQRRATPTVSQLLFETTHVLPDDTSLISWQVAGDEVDLQGTTKSAAALIGIIERSKIFDRGSFKSPVMQEQAGGERFSIAAHIATKAGP